MPSGPPAAVLVRPGDPAKYLALAGGTHDATVTAVRLDGSVDLSVHVPGVADPVAVTWVPVKPNGRVVARGTCWPVP